MTNSVYSRYGMFRDWDQARFRHTETVKEKLQFVAMLPLLG